MRFVVFSDSHISDIPNTSQEAAVDWALQKSLEISPDALICAGDVTACASPDAAIRLSEKLRALPFPSVVVPGNSELRRVDTAPLLERFYSSYPSGLKLGDIRIVGMNFSHDSISHQERARLDRITGDEKLILVSHQGHKFLDENSLSFLSSWISARKNQILIWFTGHVHVQEEDVFEGIREFALRAIDPDKCIGGLPQLIQVDTDGSDVSLTEHLFSGGQLCEWSEDEKSELLGLLGVTCYEPEKDIDDVMSLGIRHVELQSVTDKELPLIKRWRDTVDGTTLSVHLPSLDYDGKVFGESELAARALSAVAAGADRVVVHPPYVKIKNMYLTGAFEELADSMACALKPVCDAGILILAENNHTAFGTSSDVYGREFGCSPVELMAWRNALCERLGKFACGICLDIASARSNVPISMEYPIGKWYPIVGPYADEYNLHQTAMEQGGKMHNHFPVEGIHNGVVSFCGFLHEWHKGTLRHAPVILEVKYGEGATETYKRLKKIITESIE